MTISPKKFFRGFTIVEIMVALFIFILAIGGINYFIVQNYKNYQYSLEQNLAIEEARNAMGYLVKEIREAKSSDAGDYAIAQATDQSFIFYSDIDQDIAVEKVRYFREGNNFKKGVTEPNGNPLEYNLLNEQLTTITEHLITTSTPIFFYYNGNYPGDTQNNPLTTPADVTEVKLIRIHLIINVDPNRPPPDYLLDTFVQLRNLKDNL